MKIASWVLPAIPPGREKEDQFLHMVVASFLQKRSLYVSKVEGGYQVNNLEGVFFDG